MSVVRVATSQEEHESSLIHTVLIRFTTNIRYLIEM